MRSAYKYEWPGFYSRYSDAIRLTKPIPPQEIKDTFVQLKGIYIDLSKNEFRSEKMDLFAYLSELFSLLDPEEVELDYTYRLTAIPDSLWKPGLKKFKLNRNPQSLIHELKPSRPVFLEGLQVSDCSSLQMDPSLFAHPGMKELYLDNYDADLSGLSHCTHLEVLQLSANKVVLPVDPGQFKNLESLQLSNVTLQNPGPDFSSLNRLANLTLRNITIQPSGTDRLTALKNLSLSNISGPGQQPVQFDLGDVPVLEYVHIEYCHLAFDQMRANAPGLQNITIRNEEEFIQPLPISLLSGNHPSAVNLHYVKLPKGLIPAVSIGSLTVSGCDLQGTEPFLSAADSLSVGSQQKAELVNWKQLSRMKRLSYSGPDVPELGAENKELASLHFRQISNPVSIPESLHECPSLSFLEVAESTIEYWPDWTSFPSLTTLRVSSCSGFRLMPNMMLWKKLKELHTGVLAEEKRVFLKDLEKITGDESLPDNSKLVIGLLLFRDADALIHSGHYKEALLQVLNCKSHLFRQLGWEYLWLLNERLQKEFTIADLQGKTVAFLGKSKNNKSYYKEKAEKAGFTFKNNADEKTEVVLVGESFEIPEGFWNHPHLFLTETQLENLVKEVDPGYVQTLNTDELHNLRQLIWSNEVENEKLVVEMIKGGGMSDALVPDLLVVAKTSKDAGVKTALKKLLKARLSEGGQKILSDKMNIRKPSYHNPFEIYAGYDKDMDVSQMALTFAKREKQSFVSFFSSQKSLDNPYREEIFKEVLPHFFEKPHYLTCNWHFNAQEFFTLLSHETFRGKLKRLSLGYCPINGIAQALLLHKDTLEDLQFHSSEEEMPAEIGMLGKLKRISVTSDHCKTLPASWAGLKKMKDFLFYNKQKMILPEELRQLASIERFYCSGGVEIH